MAESFEERYPSIAAWVNEPEHRIEIGSDEYSSSLIRVIDPGGMIWESDKPYTSIDDALADAERAISEWLASN
ncbi:MAG: hypothetical protein V2J55_14345 [Candidatus Competibacteraceae bacterium]|jgi:hypothetical protein|nr:hypothetical protein [Candidatus Competibacteraceae bacterium]